MRSVLSILAVVGVLSARADALPVCPEAWDYSPFDAKAEDGTIAVRSGACVLSTCIDGAFSDSFEYVADVTPAEAGTAKGKGKEAK